MPRNLEHRDQTLYLLHPLAEFLFIDLADGWQHPFHLLFADDQMARNAVVE